MSSVLDPASPVKPAAQPYLDAFERRTGAEPDWLADTRRAALGRFAELGIPGRRQENWRFTNFRPLEQQVFPPLAGGDADRSALAPFLLAEAQHRIVLVNGAFSPALSSLDALPPGARLAPLSEIIERDPALARQILSEGSEGNQPFRALNAGFAADGYVLLIEAGAQLDRPLQIIHLGAATSPLSAHSRSFVRAGAGSRAAVLESFVGSGPYWLNAVAGIELGAGAALHHAVLQEQGAEAVHTADTRVSLAAGARYESFLLTLGGRLSRQDVYIAHAGEKAGCALDGAFLLRGAQEATIATLIDHQAPGCKTREVFKGVLGDHSHGVFQGKISVRQAAQQTDAHQTSRNLLLSDRAVIDTKPELEIYADDVKCSHGATVGELEETALFYLQARGIPEEEARRILIEAFAAEAIDLIEDPVLRAHLRACLDQWLKHSGG